MVPAVAGTSIICSCDSFRVEQCEVICVAAFPLAPLASDTASPGIGNERGLFLN